MFTTHISRVLNVSLEQQTYFFFIWQLLTTPLTTRDIHLGFKYKNNRTLILTNKYSPTSCLLVKRGGSLSF